ncbi:unnamed protein product [Cylindrotheca closterium]|uniref:Uncharacterized protein n=1 Tax=Cylindrotheca closterium TaxID=2856 RepID=A0AAD2CRS0_9STRA|nr:unnamed protein product [Cylindrotheca closterium]
MSVQAVVDTREHSLEDIELGSGRWKAKKLSWEHDAGRHVVSPSFATYAARILLNFDPSVASWWRGLQLTYALLPLEEQRSMLSQRFGSFAASIQASMDSFIVEEMQVNNDTKTAWEKLFSRYIEKYGDSDAALRQICILFSILPMSEQPLEHIQQYKSSIKPDTNIDQAINLDSFFNDYSALLPGYYGCQISANASSYAIFPLIDLYEIGINEEFGQAVTATTFGPLSSIALSRDLLDYSLDIYALFGVSGATGCALTHSVVIPLDVLKTKAQTNPEEYSDIISGVSRVVQEEGLQGLLTGAQATLAGYFWYGLSVYPSYAFFKRFIGQSLLPLDFSALHTNDIALISGALSAVIASLGLTPLEAARIRVVADPNRYKPLGLLGTMKTIVSEDESLGWKALYAGLPALMTRQVIFGSIKFLAFERACDAIFMNWPSLRDLTWTALGVSLVAGAFSGTVSSVVSQPADAVLTYVAQRTDTKGNLSVIEGCRLMIEESGVTALFRGLGSRSLWAAAIIAGQFLLYDVFRNAFGVTADDLTQVYTLKL